MKPGLYKVEIRTVNGVRSGVLYVENGRMLGGNSAFAFIGTYSLQGDDIVVDMSTIRHNDDSSYRPLFGADKVELSMVGRPDGGDVKFEGGTAVLRDMGFASLMTPIHVPCDCGLIGPAEAIANGLYSMHIRMLDGVDGGNTGVVLLHNGLMHGGDHSFDYVGAYTCANGRWKGELVNHEHTPPQGGRHIFGGYEVGIGFSGSYADGSAVAEATALAGKRSIRFKAELKLIAKV